MAGNTATPPVIWNVGATAGVNYAGGTAALPAAPTFVGAATAVSTDSPPPAGAPLFVVTPTNDLYVWVSTAWFGPYKTST